MARAIVFFFFLLISTATSFNITHILSQFPDFSVYNGYLTQTGLALDINSRNTITSLAMSNNAMSVLSGRNLLVDSIKRIISLHVILDYYDQNKLQGLTGGSALLTTLYQTTGTATSQEGFLNVTKLSSGKIMFGSAIRGSSLTAELLKPVATEPYNISILQISNVIIPPGFENSSAPASQVNITSALLNSGFQAFAELLQSSGAIQTYQGAENNGLTIFAPVDQALHVLPSNLTRDQRTALASYHAVGGYHPMQYLKKVTGPLSTLASTDNSNFQLTVRTNGQNVTVNSGLNTVNVGNTILDQQQIVIYSIDAALQPPEIFSSGGASGKAPSPNAPPAPPAPTSPTPAASPIPSNGSSPAPVSPADSGSPPAPPTAGAPSADGQDSSPPAYPQPQIPAPSPPDDDSSTRLAYSSCLAAVFSIFYYVFM